jgi:hypothetical protein
MRWAGNVARVGRRQTHRGFWWGNQREKFHLEDLGKGRRKILKRTVDWTYLAQKRNKWGRAVFKDDFHKIRGIS